MPGFPAKTRLESKFCNDEAYAPFDLWVVLQGGLRWRWQRCRRAQVARVRL